MSASIKDINTKIIRELLIDGRADFTAIGEKLGISEKNVWYRYRALKKAGVIIGATTLVHYKRCDYGIYTTFVISMNPNKREEVIKKIEKIQGVYFISRGIQHYVLAVGITIKNMDQIEKIKNFLASITLADKITTEIWLKIKKN